MYLCSRFKKHRIKDKMEKLINLNVIEAQKVICVWRNDCDEHTDVYCGIALDTTSISYIIPRYIAIGTYNTGKVMAGGLMDLNYINQPEYYSEEYGLFLYHQFMHYVGLYEAKALVRGGIDDGEYDDVQSAKVGIYADLLSAEMEMSDEAKEYFNDSQRKTDDDILNKKLSDCHIRSNTLSILRQNQIETVRDLVSMSETDFLNLKRIKYKTYREEIKRFMTENNLSWEMDV